MKDSLGREYGDSKGIDSGYLLQSGPKVPYKAEPTKDPEKEKEFKDLEQVRKLLGNIEEHIEELSDSMKDLLSRDKKHAERVVEKTQEIKSNAVRPEPRKPKLSDVNGCLGGCSSILTSLQKSAANTEGLTASFTAAALHKGSIFTHDIHIFSQLARTNQLLLALLKETAKNPSQLRLKDVVPATGSHPSRIEKVTMGSLESKIGQDLYKSTEALNRALSEKTKAVADRTDSKPQLAAARYGGKKKNKSHTVGELGAGTTSIPGHAAPRRPTVGGGKPPVPEEDDGTGITESDRPYKKNKRAWHRLNAMERILRDFEEDSARTITGMATKLSAGLLAGKAMKPLAFDVASAVQYQMESRKIGFITQGITQEMATQQDQFMNRKGMQEAAIASGSHLAEVEKTYLKNLSSGYKNQKDSLKVTRAGLNLAKMIDSNAEETAASFHDMYMSLRLSTGQMTEISKGMQQAARFSKMSGESLMKALQASKPLLENLKNAGNLDAKSAKNIIKITAEMQKLGISEQMAPLMDAMTSMAKFTTASPETQALASNLAGDQQGLNDMWAGKLATSPEGQAKMAVSSESMMKNTVGFGPEDYKKKTKMERSIANMKLQKAFGISLDAAVQFHDTMKRGGMTLAEKVAEIDTQGKAAKTSEEKAGLVKQKEGVKQESRSGILTSMGEIGETYGKNKTVSQSLQEASTTSGGREQLVDITKDLTALIKADSAKFAAKGITTSTLQTPEGIQKALKQTYLDSINHTNDMLKNNSDSGDDHLMIKNPEKMISDAFADKSGDKMKSLVDSMTQGGQKADRRALEDTDPILAAQGRLTDISTKLATTMGVMVTTFMGLIGETGILTVAFGALAADLFVLTTGGTLFDRFGRKNSSAASAGGRVKAGLPPKSFMDRTWQKTRIAGKSLGRTGPGQVALGIHQGLKEGFTHFGKSSSKMMSSALAYSKNNIVTRTIGKVIPRQLKDIVATAFSPKVMADRLKKGWNDVSNMGSAVAKKGRFAKTAIGESKVFKAVGSFFEPLGNDIKNFGSMVAQGSRHAATWVGESKLGKAVAGKAGNAKKAIGEAGGTAKRFLGGKMNLGEGVFRAAAAQEKIPGWGKFASMFGAGAQISSAAGILPGAAGAMGSGGAGMAGTSAGAKSIASVATKALLPVLVFTTAMLAMNQGLDTVAAATDRAGKEGKKLAETQRAAAESAGFLTGILNTLTFGVFSSWIGATGSLTGMLYEFLEKWSILTYAIQAIMIPVKVAYGILMGLWEFTKEVFYGIWEGIKMAVEPLGEIFTHLQSAFESLGEVFRPITDALQPLIGEMGGSLSIIGTLTSALRMLGVAVGFVFKAIGWVIGGVLRILVPIVTTMIDVFVGAIRTIVEFASPMIEGLVRIFAGVSNVVAGVWNLLRGLFTLDYNVISDALLHVWNGLASAIGGLVQFALQSIFGLVLTLPSMFSTALGSLASGLHNIMKRIGSALFGPIGEAFMSALGWPLQVAAELFKGVGSALAWVGELFSKLSKGDFSGIWSDLKKGFQDTAGKLPGWLWEGIKALPEQISSGLSSVATMFYDFMVGAFEKIDQWCVANLPFYGSLKSGAQAVGDSAGRIGDAYQNEGVLGATGQVINEGASAVKWAAGQVGGAVKGAWDWGTGMLGFAEGGIVTSPGLAMVGEAGPEAIIPLSVLTSAGLNPGNLMASGSLGGVASGYPSIGDIGIKKGTDNTLLPKAFKKNDTQISETMSRKLSDATFAAAHKSDVIVGEALDALRKPLAEISYNTGKLSGRNQTVPLESKDISHANMPNIPKAILGGMNAKNAYDAAKGAAQAGISANSGGLKGIGRALKKEMTTTPTFNRIGERARSAYNAVKSGPQSGLAKFNPLSKISSGIENVKSMPRVASVLNKLKSVMDVVKSDGGILKDAFNVTNWGKRLGKISAASKGALDVAKTKGGSILNVAKNAGGGAFDVAKATGGSILDKIRAMGIGGREANNLKMPPLFSKIGEAGKRAYDVAKNAGGSVLGTAKNVGKGAYDIAKTKGGSILRGVGSNPLLSRIGGGIKAGVMQNANDLSIMKGGLGSTQIGGKINSMGTAAMNFAKTKGAAALPGVSRVLGAGRAIPGMAKLGGMAKMVPGLIKAIPGISKLSGAFKLVSKVALPLSAAIGGISTQFDTDAMGGTYGKSWEDMNIQERGGARGANFITGAIGGLDPFTPIKNLLVGGLSKLGIEVPKWAKDFDLAVSLGFGPTGTVTKGVSYVTGAIAHVGTAIGTSLGHAYSYLSGETKRGQEFDKAQIAIADKTKKDGTFYAHNDSRNENKAAWLEESKRVASVKSLEGGLSKSISTKDAGSFQKDVGPLISAVLKQDKRYGSTGEDDWSKTISLVEDGKKRGLTLDPETQKSFDELVARNQKDWAKGSTRSELGQQGIVLGKDGVTKEIWDSMVEKGANKKIKDGFTGPTGRAPGDVGTVKVPSTNAPNAIEGLKISKSNESIMSSQKMPMAPLSKDPDKIIDTLSDTLSKQSVLQSRMVGESAVLPTARNTTGINPVDSYSNLFGQDGSLAQAESTRSRIEPTPLQDIHDRIQQEIAMASPSNSSVTSPELSEIAQYTDEGNEHLIAIKGYLQEMAGHLRPSNIAGNSGAGVGSTRSQIRPQGASQYYNLSFGKYGDRAQSSFVNDGVS